MTVKIRRSEQAAGLGSALGMIDWTDDIAYVQIHMPQAKGDMKVSSHKANQEEVELIFVEQDGNVI